MHLQSTFILFRHFQTLDDRLRLHTPSEADPPFVTMDKANLDEMCSEMCKIVSFFEIKRVVTSDNIRGRRTAEMLTAEVAPALPIYEDNRLRNMLQPEWAGLSYKEITSSEVYRIWHTTPEKALFTDGENLRDVDNRIKSLLDDLEDEPTLFVSHTTPLQVLGCNLLGIPAENLWSFKYDFKKFTLIHRNTLLRFNSKHVSDADLGDLHVAVSFDGVQNA